MPSTWDWIELNPSLTPWQSQPGKIKLIFVAINMPGYYSLPARILALLANTAEGIGDQFDCRFVEIENNQPQDALLQSINAYRPDIVAFTINIWNRDPAIRLASDLRRLLPELALLAGGQEITRSVYNFFELAPAFDFLIEGEGEIPFLQLLRQFQKHKPRVLADPQAVSGLRYRVNSEIVFTRQAEVVNSLDEIPSVILAGLVPISQKNLLGVMIEGSRGCPFHCAFCFEGAQREKVRKASLARLKAELEYMVDKGATYFHMMDAILCNSEPERLRGLRDIFDQLKVRRPKTIISAELYADRITEEISPYLSTFTIIDLGLQTTNPATAKAIHRNFSPEKYHKGIKLLRKTGSTFSIYLICGLPFETMASFLNGIKFVLDLMPTRIFINELCLLNGTELRYKAQEYEYDYDPLPPYMVFASAWMSRFVLRTVQVISKVIERRYNLTTRAIHSTAPWLPKLPNYRKEQRSICFSSHCSRECCDCRNSSDNVVPPTRENIAQCLRDASDLDMNIHIGDGASRGPDLLQLAGLLQLSATARNRLIGPLSAFSDAKGVELLVLRGFWHFRTFLAIKDKEQNEHDLAVINSFNRPFQLVGFATIRPLLEVLLLPENCSSQEYEESITNLVQRKVTVISVPEQLAQRGPEWRSALIRAFANAIEQRVWLKLPKDLAREALAPHVSESLDEIIALLEEFEMLSNDGMQPPCFISTDTSLRSREIA